MDGWTTARQRDAAGQGMDIRPRGGSGAPGSPLRLSEDRGVTLEAPLLCRRTIHTLPRQPGHGLMSSIVIN